jgi:hypothetical protein
MLYAHTVRKLKPGSFDQFAEAFGPQATDAPPPGWKHFTMLRNLADPDQVVTFGQFDGTLEELEAQQAAGGYDEQIASVAPLVEEVIANGVYEVARDVAVH